VTGEGCDSKLLGSGSLESGLEDAAESDQKLVSRILFAQPKKQLPPNHFNSSPGLKEWALEGQLLQYLDTRPLLCLRDWRLGGVIWEEM